MHGLPLAFLISETQWLSSPPHQLNATLGEVSLQPLHKTLQGEPRPSVDIVFVPGALSSV